MINNVPLLHAIRNTVSKLLETEDENERCHLLGAVDQILNVMLHHHDTDFMMRYFLAGRELLVRGTKLLAEGDEQVRLSEVPEHLSPELSADFQFRMLELISGKLATIVELIPVDSLSHADHYLREVTDWENALYARYHTEAIRPNQEIIPEIRIEKEAFERYITEKYPTWRNLKVAKFNRLPGGFSKSTILVETEDSKNGQQALVIRAMQATYIVRLHSYDVVNEYPIVRIAYEAGIPVAEPLWLEDDKKQLGTSFIVSRQAYGDILGSAIGPDGPIPETTMRSLVATLVKIHQIDLMRYEKRINDNPELRKWYNYPTIAEYNKERNQYWRNIAREAGATHSPLVKRAFRWLDNNIEQNLDKPGIVHGDFGLHNILITNDKVSAVLDWEIAHIGDPAVDLSWLYLCTGKQYEPSTLLAMYKEAGGREVSEFAFRYQQVFHCIMMPITCIASANLLYRRLDNILYAQFGLLFMSYNTSHLNEDIQLAEACR